mgnify:FL=1
MTMRTHTGLLEMHLENIQAIEQLCRHRQMARRTMGDDETEVVDKTVRLAVGMERLMRRWIAIRVETETQRSVRHVH